jgi:hypothetical protein
LPFKRGKQYFIFINHNHRHYRIKRSIMTTEKGKKAAKDNNPKKLNKTTGNVFLMRCSLVKGMIIASGLYERNESRAELRHNKPS